MTTYRDAGLRFTYSYPSSFKSQPAFTAALAKGAAGDSSDPEQAKAAGCLTIPAGAVKNETLGGELQIGMVIIVKVDHTCIGEPGSPEKLGEAAQRFVKMPLTQVGIPVTEDAVRYKLDGHEAAFVQGSAPAKVLGDGRMMHAGAVCALLGYTTTCWLLIDSDHKAMPALVSNPVTFDGRTPVPLVPKDIFHAW